MRSTTHLLAVAGALTLGACDAGLPSAPAADNPSFLIGNSPLRPLQGPQRADVWFWSDLKTSEMRYAATIDFEAVESLFQGGAGNDLYFVASTEFHTMSGRTVVETRRKTVAVSAVSPIGTGGEGYALVVIAVPLSDGESAALHEAFAQGGVEMTVGVEIVSTAKDGGWDVFDSVGSTYLADPRPSPLPIPDEYIF